MSNNCLLIKTAPAALFGLAALIVLPFFGCKKNIADAPEPEPQSVEQAALTAFKITKPVQAAGVIIDKAVTVQVPAGTDITALTAAATLPDGAAIDPDPKKARDYSTSVTFTVTAADGANRAAYIVTVTTAQAAAPAPEEDAAITSFTINNTAGQIDQNTRAINLILSHDTDVSALAPVIEYTGASVSPESGAARDFSAAPVTYTVTAKDGGQKAYTAAITKMAAGEYSVIYEPGGAAGSMPPSVFTFDAAARLQKNIYTKTGYTFTGWKDGAGNPFIDEREGSNFAPQGESLTLTAQWRPNTYTVVFAGNGGGGTMTDQPFEYDEAATALTAVGFTWAGYAFVNWKNGDNTYTNGQPVSNLTAEDRAKVTLTAQWVAQYTVSYNLNGGTGTTPAAETRAVGEGKALAGGFCTKIGYTFGGWNTNAAGNGTNYAAGSSQTDLSTTAGGTVTLYARWTANTYTVSYNANAPSGKTAAGTAPAPTTHTYDAAGNLAANPFSVDGYTFTGWNTKADGTGTNYNAGASVTNLTAVVSAAIPLYAQWDDGVINVPKETLDTALAWLKENAASGQKYRITLKANETSVTRVLEPNTLHGAWDSTIIIEGSGGARTVSLADKGHLFIVNSRAALILGNNITLKGISDKAAGSNNNVALIKVNQGKLELREGSKITGNTNDSDEGGGIYMDGTSSLVTISGGEISGNKVQGSTWSRGGGINVRMGTIIMTGGLIANNTCVSDAGGIGLTSIAVFTMSGGTIRGNQASGNGGGVNSAKFTMTGGTISGNKASSNGGGVSVYENTFKMDGGTISGNTAGGRGGGVYTNPTGVTFTRAEGVVIKDNKASSGNDVY